MADPWFSLEWFRFNRDALHAKLNFWGEVIFWLNPKYGRIKVYKEKARFWIVDKKGKHFTEVKPIKLLKNDRIKIGKRKALKDPKVWALAIRMKYFSFPKSWKRITKWHKKGNIESCFKEKRGRFCLYVRDSLFGHAIHIPLNFFTPKLLDEIYSKSKNVSS